MSKTNLLLYTVLLLVCFIAISTCQSIRKENIALKDDAQKELNDSIHYYKDKYNRTHAQVTLLEGDLQTVSIYNKVFLDSIASELKVLKKNIRSATAISVVSGDTITPSIDTVYLKNKTEGIHFTYNDKWINMEGIVGGTPYISYKTYDSLIVTTYTKKTGWFKHEQFLDAYSINPHSHVKGLKGFNITDDKPYRFSIGPYIGYGFNGAHLQTSIGLSIQYALIRF